MSNSKVLREETRAKKWHERIAGACRVYSEWMDRFHVKRLEEYYEGYHWGGMGLSEEDAAKRYVVNLVYASIETQKPGLLFHKPQVKIKPRPVRADDMGALGVDQMAELCQDAVQTFIDRPDVRFMFETSLAVHEAHTRFAIVEVGYSADFINNPHANKPVLQEDEKEVELEDLSPDVIGGDQPDAEGAVMPGLPPSEEQIKQPEKLVTKEKLYVKWIPADDFRVSISSKNCLEDNDWVGYKEWHYLEDVKRNKAYKNTRDLKATAILSQKYQDPEEAEEERKLRHGMVCLWKIWDLRTMTKMVLAEGHKRFLQEGGAFAYLPFADLKFLERPKHYYPMPVVYNWIGPQDQINDIRDMRRLHRKRFVRRYTATRDGIEQSELEKLESGEDGVVAWAKLPGGNLIPVPDAPLDSAVFKDAADSRQDFIEVSGVTSDSRGVADSTTATQANILNSRMQIRESKARMAVGEWLSRIARLMLFTLRDRMSLPFMVTLQSKIQQTGPSDPMEVDKIVNTWQAVQSEDLGTLDMDVSVELSTLSPVAEEEERNSWSQVLALMSNQQLAMLLGDSDVLLRKTLALYGVREEQEVQEIKRVLAQMAAMTAMMMGQQAAQTSAAGAAPQMGAAMGPPELPAENPGGQVNMESLMSQFGGGQ